MAVTIPYTFAAGANSQFLTQLDANFDYIVTVVRAGN